MGESRTPIVYNETAATVQRDIGAGPFDRFDEMPAKKARKNPMKERKIITDPAKDKGSDSKDKGPMKNNEGKSGESAVRFYIKSPLINLIILI